jgi:hypothetical protein
MEDYMDDVQDAQELTGNEPIDLGEGAKEKWEPVVAEDVDKVGKLNKDALRVFALKKFGFSLDLSQHIAIIRGNLVKKCLISLGEMLQDEDTDAITRQAIEKVIPMYMKHPINGRVFNSSPALLKRLDLIPCTKEGMPLRANEYYIPENKPQHKINSKNEMERMAAGMERQIEQ